MITHRYRSPGCVAHTKSARHDGKMTRPPRDRIACGPTVSCDSEIRTRKDAPLGPSDCRPTSIGVRSAFSIVLEATPSSASGALRCTRIRTARALEALIEDGPSTDG